MGVSFLVFFAVDKDHSREWPPCSFAIITSPNNIFVCEVQSLGENTVVKTAGINILHTVALVFTYIELAMRPGKYSENKYRPISCNVENYVESHFF